MKRLAFLLVALCLLSAAACGDGSSSSPTATVAPAQTNAATPASNGNPLASLLMGRDDFPRDYLEKKSVPNAATDAIAACRLDALPSATGIAGTDDWRFDGDTPAISETVTLFATPADATARITSAPAFADCIVKAINDGKFNETSIEVSGATTSAITIDAAGDTAVAFAVQATQTFTRQMSKGTARYTVALVTRGRIVAELLVRGTGTPFDPQELSDLVQTAASRLPKQ